MNRRSVLALAGLTGVAACRRRPGDVDREPGRPAPGGNAEGSTFTNPLRIPPLADSVVGADGIRRFRLTLQPGTTEFLPGRSTATLGINGAYLGPTVRAARGERVTMAVVNRLDTVSTLHWHGMRLPAKMDGGPHQPIHPGATWSPSWTIDQPAATLWYHPHPHGTTAKQVYRGMAGMFILDDDTSARLGLPNRYGIDDIPLIVQDKKFTRDGTLDEANDGDFGILGDHILVNGVHNPLLQVTTTRVRLRVLNASNARTYNLGFREGRAFHVIATDTGLLPAPAATDRVRVSPGERAEFVVELRAGEQAMLTSTAGPYVLDRDQFAIMRITAAATLAPSPPLPQELGGRAIASAPGARIRRFTLSGKSEINGRELDMDRIDEIVPARAREIWEICATGCEHNFHIHDVAFGILDIDGAPPPAHLRGPKDTVFLPEDTKVRLAVEFGDHTDPTTPYMFHCHLLLHEDREMMGQFVVVEPGTEDQTPRILHD